MTSIRLLYFVLVIFTLSVDARRHTNPGRRQQQQQRRGGRRMQEEEASEGLNENSAVTRGKGGGDSLPPELPTLPPIPFSTKSPSRSSSSAPSNVPKGQDSPTVELTPSPVPLPVPVPETTTTAPSVSFPTTTTSMPSYQELPVEGGSPAPSPSSSNGLVSPTEMSEEESRTRPLLPFSLDVTDQPGVDELRLVIQDFLYQRLSKSFSNLESILLTVTNNEPQRRRKLGSVPRLQSQHRRQQEEEEDAAADGTMTKTFNFTGDAMFFLDQGTIPTAVEVQRAQLQALEDFHRLNQFIITEGGYSWQIDIIELDGMIINKDGMVVGDSGEMVNDGDTMVQESYQSQGDDSDSNNNALAISLSVIASILVLVGILVGLLVYRRRNTNADDEPKETYQELIRSVDDLPKDLEPLPNDKNTMNISFESATVATTSFDSVQLSTPEKGRGPGSPSNMDWNRVFALSQSPVEETMAEVFEPKTLVPPKSTKVHEIVTLAPVAEGGLDNEIGQDGDGEDSYGYGSLPDEGHQDGFVMSSPVAPPMEVNAGNDNDNDDDFVPRGDHYNQDRDLTIDLSDFNIDPDNDPK